MEKESIQFPVIEYNPFRAISRKGTTVFMSMGYIRILLDSIGSLSPAVANHGS